MRLVPSTGSATGAKPRKSPFVLGHALYLKAIHGGKVKNDKLVSEKLAFLLRGGNFPVTYAYPAAWRATRDTLHLPLTERLTGAAMSRGEPIALNGNVGVCDSHQVRKSFYAVGAGSVAIFAKDSEAKMD